MPDYKRHEYLVSTARLTPDLPRLIVGVIGIEMLYSLALSFLDSAMVSLPDHVVDSYVAGDTPAGLLAHLVTFAFLAIAVTLVAKFLNHRGFWSLVGDRGQSLRDLRVTALACVAVFAAIELLPPYWSFDGVEQRNLALWLIIFPLSVGVLIIQTGAEELFYRGYIQQQLAARLPNPWIWMIAPNLLFASAHWQNGGGFNDSVGYVIWAFAFGLAASDLTARTGNLGAAIGFHLANNIYAFLFFGEKGAPDSGLALWLINLPEEYSDFAEQPILNIGLLIELIMVLLIWLAARVAVRR